MEKKKGKGLKKKRRLLENSSSGIIGVKKKLMKKKKNKNKKNALLVLNTSVPSSSNLNPTPTRVFASTSLLVPSKKKKKVKESRMKRMETNENKPGFIFMCNRKTKPECYRYRIFGLPRGKLDVVKNIEPGTKLFLYDFDLKLLYGVYEATSIGALDLEPNAFNGLFPAQVKFNILKDSLPLPEATFRYAIIDNYQGGSKFKQELSPIQVKSLISLFHDIVVTPSSPTVPFLPCPIAPPIWEEEARFPPQNPYFPSRYYVRGRPPLDTRTKQLVQLRECGPNEYRSYVAPLIVEGEARFPLSENQYLSRRHYVLTRPSLDTETEQLVQHRERGLKGYQTYIAPSMLEKEGRFPPSENTHFSRHHYLPTRPPHDTESEVVQHRDSGLQEYQTPVAGLQPSVELKHAMQSEALYHDKPYYLAEACQPYVPENPRLVSPDSHKRNLTLMNPRDQDIGGHLNGSDYFSANLAGERKPISPANFARERQQPLHVVEYPHSTDYYVQHLHPTTSVSVPAHGAHPQPDLQHLPPNHSYYTAQNPGLLHGGMTQRTVPVSYGNIDGNILVTSRHPSAGIAPSYR